MLSFVIYLAIVSLAIIGRIYMTRRTVPSTTPTPLSTEPFYTRLNTWFWSWWPFPVDTTWLIVEWIGLLLLPLLFGEKGARVFSLRDFWWDIVTSFVGLSIIAGLTLYGYAKQSGSLPFRYKLAKIGLWIYAIVAVLVVFKGPISYGINTGGGIGAVIDRVKGGASTSLSAYGGKTTYQREVNDFWFGAGIPHEHAEKMVNIVKFETADFRQFKDDGAVFQGLIDPDDIGLHQINRRVNAERIKKLGFDVWTKQGDQRYNIYTPQGNMNVAFQFYKEREFQDWERTVKRME
ncbi:MAG: hypothetical protein CEO12_611, partial [Parcubacteria group bacterium Gr01-1014_46]